MDDDALELAYDHLNSRVNIDDPAHRVLDLLIKAARSNRIEIAELSARLDSAVDALKELRHTLNGEGKIIADRAIKAAES